MSPFVYLHHVLCFCFILYVLVMSCLVLLFYISLKRPLRGGFCSHHHAVIFGRSRHHTNFVTPTNLLFSTISPSRPINIRYHAITTKNPAKVVISQPQSAEITSPLFFSITPSRQTFLSHYHPQQSGQ